MTNAIESLGATRGRLRRIAIRSAAVDDHDVLLEVSDNGMGTTRMNKDPAKGVVDEDSRVHGVSNLYVAGSSIFPTSGIGNPTLTLLAMTYRLSDHLKTEMRA